MEKPRSGRDRKGKHIGLQQEWQPPVIRHEYVEPLGRALQQLSECDSLSELRNPPQNRRHGFREPDSLTDFGDALHRHLFESDDDAEALGSQLFRIRVTAKARYWALADADRNLIQLTFWDPHHRLSSGHRYNDSDIPWSLGWADEPKDDDLTD